VKLPVYLWLGCAIACAQSSDVEIATAPRAEVRISPNVRGDLSVSIFTSNAPDVSVRAIRQNALACDWHAELDYRHYVTGTCRRYLKSDGTSAQGTVALAPLVSGLRQAGIVNVHLVLRDEGTPLAAAPQGWKLKPPASTRFGSTSYKTYEFWSQTAEQLPQPLEIRIGHAWSSTRLTIPFGFTLLGPAILALWLRRRAERKCAAATASIWVHWILTGMWLYWISTVSLEDIAALGAHLQFNSMLLSFLLGTVLFAGAPILAVASCIAILMRTPEEPGRQAGTGGLVLRSVAREAAIMIPFGMFLVGMGMMDQDRNIAMLSLPAAFLTYKLLSWWLGRQMSGGMEVLTRGPMVAIASEIARRAGLTLGQIYIFGSRGAREANAFAAPGRILAMTRGLVENLTAREIIAVMGHEIGHMRRKHVGTRMLAFWAYVLIIGPLMAHWAVRYHLPSWILSLPLMPLGYILATAYLSRKHEFSADAQAVQLVGDAEGMIAALAHLRQITRSPVDWGGMQGSILSHPSMRDRVLSIARRFNVPEDRALALLENPDLLNADVPPEQLHFRLPAECTSQDLVFTTAWKQGYILISQWLGYVALVVITLGVCRTALWLMPVVHWRIYRLALLGVVPVITALYLAFLSWMDRGAMKILRRKLRRRMAQVAEGGTFAGLMPGGSVGFVDGFGSWDLGFLFLTPDALTYHGERAAFSLRRGNVTAISIAKGPISWSRDYVVVVASPGASFSFSRPDRGRSRRQARRLARQFEAWFRGEPAAFSASVSPAPPPDRGLMVAAAGYVFGWRVLRRVATRAFFLFIGLALALPLVWWHWSAYFAFAPFVCPLAYLLAFLPILFRRRPAPIIHSAATKPGQQSPAAETAVSDCASGDRK